MTTKVDNMIWPEEDIGSTPGITKKSIKIYKVKVPSPAKVYTSNIGRGRAPRLRWEPPEYDLAEIGRILDVEAFVRRAYKIKKNLFLKEGYEFIGSNPERVGYIKKRIHQMELATDIPFPMLMSQVVAALLRQSNALLVKKRDEQASGGKVRQVKNKTLKPIAGYFPLPAETIFIKRDEYGKIVKFCQDVYGKKAIEFSPDDVVHFTSDRREGYAFGVPELVAVQDDIRALRRIEENVELLVQQHLFPLFHYQVGTDDAPASVFPDGQDEIDVVKSMMNEMPSDGLIVTPERHNIKVLGAQGNALNVDKVIAHFKQRIYTGLGVSSVDMGEGGTSNRSTAQTMSRNLIDDIKAAQKEFGAQFYSFIIQELLQESTFPEETLLDEENRVYIKFKEIDKEARIALEEHAAQMYENNIFTHDQTRRYIGEEIWEEEDWENSFWKQIKEPSIMMQSLDEPWSPEAKAVARAATTSVEEGDRQAAEAKSDKVRKEELSAKKTPGVKALNTRKSGIKKNKAGANKVRPQNQHGRRKGPKLNKDFQDAAPTSLSPVFNSRRVLPIQDTFNKLKEDLILQIRSGLVIHKDVADLGLGEAFEIAKGTLTKLVQDAYRIGIRDTGIQPWDVKLNTGDAIIEKHVYKYVDKLRDELKDHIKRNIIAKDGHANENVVFIQLIMDALEHRTHMIDNSEIMRGYNYGLASGYIAQGVENLKSYRSGTTACDVCDNHFLKYNGTNVILYDELPPLHPLCSCLVGKDEEAH